MPRAEHADHFASLEGQAHAAKLGMWVFLCSEVLLFASLFVLYAGARAHDPAGFRVAVGDAAHASGFVNTAILLTSSTTMALAVGALARGRSTRALALVVVTAVLGSLFLAVKLSEYATHLREGIHPGAGGAYFATSGASPLFWTLYFVMTGLHGVHVLVGVAVLVTAAFAIRARTLTADSAHRLELVGLYWHLVDLVWIFLWPLFYLA